MALIIELGFNEGTGATTANSAPTGGAIAVPTGLWVTPGHGNSDACTKSVDASTYIEVNPWTTSGHAYTVMCWFRMDATKSGYLTIMHGNAGGLEWVEMSGGGVVDWFHDQGGIITGPTVGVGEWHHIAVSGDGTTRKLYVDGVLAGSVPSAHLHNNEFIHLGSGDGGAISRDDFRVFDTALSDAEVVTWMNNYIGGQAPELLEGSAEDSVGITDSTSSVASGGGTALDKAGVSDSISLVRTVNKSLSETVRLSDVAVPEGENVVLRQWFAGISADKRYYVDQYGQPILLQGDSPWSAFTDMSVAQWETWCQNREDQGFNSAIVSILGATANGAPSNDGATFDGIVPFVGGDIKSRNEAYWARMDEFMQIALDHGITVFWYLLDGWTDVTIFVNKSISDCTNFGTFVGERYGHLPNIVWMFGGDYFPITNEPEQGSDTDHRMNAIIEAVKAVEERDHLVGIQLGYNRSWSAQNPYWRTRIDWNFVYTYFPTYDAVREARATVVSMPSTFSEGHYEDGTHSLARSPEAIRRQAGWAYTSGSAGDFYGTQDWKFETGWESRLNRPGGLQLSKIRSFMATLKWWELSASLSLISSGAGTPYVYTNVYADTNIMLNTYATAAVNYDRSLGLIYVPTSRTLGIDLSKIGPNPQFTWVDASNTSIKNPVPVSTSITSPGTNSAGNQDWFLLINADPIYLTAEVSDSIDISDSASTDAVVTGEVTKHDSVVVTDAVSSSVTSSKVYVGTRRAVTQYLNGLQIIGIRRQS